MVEFNDSHNDLTVRIEDGVMQTIQQKSLASYPNETGGFLVGKYDSNKIAYVSLLIEPTQKHGTPCSYQRSTKGMKKIWDRLFSQGYIYLGEWHSHPNGSCMYSQTDFQSIESIANSEEVHITHPLMLIVSVNKDKLSSYQLYHYCEGHLITFE